MDTLVHIHLVQCLPPAGGVFLGDVSVQLRPAPLAPNFLRLDFSIVRPPFKNKKRKYDKTAPSKTLRFGLCICVKNMCGIQFSIMVAQTDVPVNAFGKILSRANENNSYALLGKQGVCIYKRSKPTVPGDAGNRRFCLLGSIPNPLNSVSRWLRLCEPDGF